MPITLGGSRWNEQDLFEDDISEENALTPLDDDYIPEEYRDSDYD